MYSVFITEPRVSTEVKCHAANGRGYFQVEPDLYLAEYVIRALHSLSVQSIKMIYKERGKFTKSSISVEKDKDELLAMLKSLARDESFFTLGWPRSVLLIPFERYQFNLITADTSTIPSDPLLEILDSTDILRDYPDAYEMFGVDAMFPGEHPALS